MDKAAVAVAAAMILNLFIKILYIDKNHFEDML
ncbi:hypothetical protein VIBR0546_12602 [Vibrio brasiliensis LMG 20546]|uniref:Uncharacterized protein n=1 Tax=Vibrio brasiliensis LMG 20546 TaxID=945543 RepID=E8LP15_9VIBR|nr:hypothetical protein VIBR0546_12602 [Vibrio brasiliensis LMG 20546]